jgi:hypothetical protein
MPRHSCPECDKSFSNAWGLSVHNSRVHRDPNAEPPRKRKPSKPRIMKGVPDSESVEIDAIVKGMTQAELKEAFMSEVKNKNALKQIVNRLMLEN